MDWILCFINVVPYRKILNAGSFPLVYTSVTRVLEMPVTPVDYCVLDLYHFWMIKAGTREISYLCIFYIFHFKFFIYFIYMYNLLDFCILGLHQSSIPLLMWDDKWQIIVIVFFKQCWSTHRIDALSSSLSYLCAVIRRHACGNLPWNTIFHPLPFS